MFFVKSVSIITHSRGIYHVVRAKVNNKAIVRSTLPSKNKINDQVGISTTVLPHYYNGVIVCVRRDQNSIYYGEDVVPAINSFIQINRSTCSILD